MSQERPEALPALPPRRPESHKGNYGRILIVAGSETMPGAAILACRAALRSGAGLVTAAIPRTLGAALGAACPEATQAFFDDDPSTWPRGRFEARGGALYDAAVLGPGLGLGPRAEMLMASFLEAFPGPHVVDADAINILARADAPLPAPSPLRIWTPHPGEFQRLTGEMPRGDGERADAAARFVAARGGVLVLKGHRTVVATAGRHAFNTTGNAGMATAGSGDVLCGVIAALLGQGLGPFEAALLGVHLHGAAGDIAAREVGQVSLIASDIIERLPRAILHHAQGGPSPP